MADRRHDQRSDSNDRRTFPRPPLWLNLLLLILAAASFGYARYQRTEIKAKTALLFTPSANNPSELIHARQELADLDVTEAQFSKEVESRAKVLQELAAEQFYVAIDTKKKKLFLRFGKNIVREADVTIGEAKTIKSSSGKTWTLVPPKGAFSVRGKETDYSWSVPEWAYVMKGKTPPPTPEAVPNGMGKYVVLLPDSYAISSPPPVDGPLHGQPKPGSFVVSEADMAAIWPRISEQTRVYIF